MRPNGFDSRYPLSALNDSNPGISRDSSEVEALGGVAWVSRLYRRLNRYGSGQGEFHAPLTRRELLVDWVWGIAAGGVLALAFLAGIRP